MLGLAAVVVAAAIVALLVPIPFRGRLAVATGDFVHAPLFCGITLVLLFVLERIRPLRDRWRMLALRSFAILVCLFLFGVGMELAQLRFGRSAAIHDAVANGLGINIGVLIYWSTVLRRFQPERKWWRRMLLAAVGFLLAIAWWRPVAIVGDVAAVRWGFPTLATFESRTQFQRFYFRECRGQLTRTNATQGWYAMEVTYEPTSFPAVTLVELRPDWSAMTTLEWDVCLDAGYSRPQLEMVLKIIDEEGGTFRQSWSLTPGRPQRISLARQEILASPRSQKLDLSRIKYVDFAVVDPGEPTKLRIDAIELSL